MEKVRYMISDAANLVNVESHVLRYWEDELDLAIPRNEMGHRYYTKENIREFQKIKELKDKGYQLKAIRMLIHNGNIEPLTPLTSSSQTADTLPETTQTAAMDMPSPPSLQAVPLHTGDIFPQETKELSAEERMSQFRELMSEIVGHAIALNNEELSAAISQEVQERVLKEMDYLVREHEDAEEERYRKLDAAIRGSVRKKHALFQKKEKKKKEETEQRNKKRLPQ